MPPHTTQPAGHETVTDAGEDAPWLTLVHGMAQDRRVFSAQVDDLKAIYRILLVDLPGHGLSSSLPGPYGLEEFTAGVRGAMEAVGIGRTHYWGTHTGAGVGLLLACREPERFTSLVLEGAVLPGRPPPAVAAMLSEVGGIARAQGMEAARRHWWEASGWFAVMRDRPEACRATRQTELLADFQGGPWLDTRTPSPVVPDGAELDAELAGLRVPALILNGEHDMPDFLAVAEELMGRLPNVRRVVIAGGGGFPLWELPQAVNAEVRAFLADVQAGNPDR